MIKTKGYAAQSATSPLKPWNFERQNPGVHNVLIETQYCGICHSDIHDTRNEWHQTRYPIVPGHEIIGYVTHIGEQVTKFKVGDRVGVGCMIDSCQQCDACKNGLEQFCKNGSTMTYNSIDKHTNTTTYGGFSTHIVVPEKFAFTIPATFKDQDLPAVAPLLCAGITTYSPLRYWNIGKGNNVGIAGIGGLGHIALKIAHALQANVVAFTTTPSKKADALRLGASASVLSTDNNAMLEHRNSLDFILDTIPAAHDVTPYLNLLALNGTMCLVGLPAQNHPGFHSSSLILKHASLAGSLVGGIPQTQEMLNFCAQHGITADIELISPHMINDAFERVINKDIRYRFVVDMKQA